MHAYLSDSTDWCDDTLLLSEAAATEDVYTDCASCDH